LIATPCSGSGGRKTPREKREKKEIPLFFLFEDGEKEKKEDLSLGSRGGLRSMTADGKKGERKEKAYYPAHLKAAEKKKREEPALRIVRYNAER